MSVNKLKTLWSNAIINDKLKDILKLYVNNATFKGTLMIKPTKGKKDIEKYFKDFTPKVNDIKFLNDEVSIKSGNIINEMGTYKFYTKNGYIKAQYNFVFLIKDEEAKILSHFSNLFC